MSCVPLRHQLPQSSDETENPTSWSSIAALVRKRARALPNSEAEEMLNFADLLDGFAELEK